MYRFDDKKNREDVIALRWPKACLSCGTDVPTSVDAQHGIIGLFYVDKKTTRSDKRHTQVLVKLPGFFYMCDECTNLINNIDESLQEKHRKLLKTLKESPWMEFIEVEKDGNIRLPDGIFKDKLQRENPEAKFKSKKNPLAALNQNILTGGL